jgi:hypothetical protein
MEKRYQVFLSATYQDLQEERQQVIQALLELDCFPCSMEFFPASSDAVWDAIRTLIRECDYYLVVVGGKYGSVDSEGVSFTEKEYKFAVELKKPVAAFLPQDPGSLARRRTETNPKMQKKLEAFKDLCAQRLCSKWSSPEDLRGKVTASLVRLIKMHPAVGWVRADRVPDESAAQTINRLRTDLEEMKRLVDSTKVEAPPGSAEFAQGDDAADIQVIGTDLLHRTERTTLSFSWNELFGSVAGGLMTSATDDGMRRDIARYVVDRLRRFQSLEVDPYSFQKVKTQFLAIGLIKKCEDGQRWTLTPFGEREALRILAVKRPATHS